MKTLWNTKYLLQKVGSGNALHKWLRAKQKEYEQLTGVDWSYHSARGCYIFDAVCVGRKTKEKMEQHISLYGENDLKSLVEKARAYWEVEPRSSFGYLRIVDLALVSGIDLPTLMIALYYATRKGQAVFSVNRMGKANTIKFKRKDE